jgi:Outer membrane protein beta-barrel domain
MNFRRWIGTAGFALFASVAAPAVASAEWFVTPYVGMNWGTTADFLDVAGPFDNQFVAGTTFGGSLIWQRSPMLGFEVDFGFSPDLFADTGDPEDYQFGNSHVITLMANAVVTPLFGGQSGGRFIPYGSAGIGMIRTRIDDPFELFQVKSADVGINAGGGVAGFFSNRFGFRGEVRYFRTLQEGALDDQDLALVSLHFWRATAGVIVRF